MATRLHYCRRQPNADHRAAVASSGHRNGRSREELVGGLLRQGLPRALIEFVDDGLQPPVAGQGEIRFDTPVARMKSTWWVISTPAVRREGAAYHFGELEELCGESGHDCCGRGVWNREDPHEAGVRVRALEVPTDLLRRRAQLSLPSTTRRSVGRSASSPRVVALCAQQGADRHAPPGSRWGRVACDLTRDRRADPFLRPLFVLTVLVAGPPPLSPSSRTGPVTMHP